MSAFNDPDYYHRWPTKTLVHCLGNQAKRKLSRQPALCNLVALLQELAESNPKLLRPYRKQLLKIFEENELSDSTVFRGTT